MRKLAVVLALASTALASPSLARDKSWYVGVDGGGMLVEKIRYTINGTPRLADAKSHKGYDVGGLVGYDFGMFRVEAETSYRHANLDTWTARTTTPNFYTTGPLGNLPVGTYPNATGSTSALSFMANGLLDFGDDDGLQGFVGGGVGVSRVKAKYAISGRFLNDSDTRFSYQALAGVRYPLTDHIDIGGKYRWFTATHPRFVDITNRTVSGRFRSHSLLAELTYNFGEPVAPPPPPTPAPPPPPVTPPPPPPTVTCAPGPFIVFFEWNKSDITPEAASILDNAVTQYQNCGNARVMLAGFTDTSGTPKYNIGLSQRRADSTRAYISAHGIPDGVVSTQAYGEDPSKLRVQTADGVREVQNRRVEITYGPGSGQ